VKIAHFYNGIYFNGGISNYIQSLAKLQIAAGDEVLYFELTKTTPTESGVKPMLVESEDHLFKICREQSVDVLHFHKFGASEPPAGLNTVYTVHEHSPHCMSGGLFLKRRGIPCPRTYNFIGCCYGHVRDHCGSVRPKKFMQNLKRVHLQKAILPKVKVVCVGHFLKNRMIKAGYPDSSITVIPNFTDIDLNSVEMPLSGIPEFLFMGRLEKLKGVDWLLRAFKNVKTPAILNICGEGGEKQALKALAKQLGIEDRVTFQGWSDRAAKIGFLQSARALIVPSIWPETFGLVVVEAAACARPVIVSDAGELPYLVKNGHNGLVVEVGNIQRLTDAIEALAADPGQASRMGIHHQHNVQTSYTAAAHKNKLDAVYAGPH
jgi:glycosyltransferase involved in cell wall biosynthesis